MMMKGFCVIPLELISCDLTTSIRLVWHSSRCRLVFYEAMAGNISYDPPHAPFPRLTIMRLQTQHDFVPSDRSGHIDFKRMVLN